ncbi:MAG: hypothetical protein LBK62_01885 [Treponema sp.]|jgi:hypothetical protein|nr:hypothetical protein [Treponema sp.]
MKKYGNMKEFELYTKPLRHLELGFQKAGVPVEFWLIEYPNGMKAVGLANTATHQSYCTKSIEGDSVGQAIKDVADAVKL